MLSQIIDKTENLLYETMIDDTMNENTESHTMRLSDEMEPTHKTFKLVFSNTMLKGKKISSSKAKLQLDFVDVKTGKLLARSNAFTIAPILKGLSNKSRMSLKDIGIRLNNLTIGSKCKLYS